MLIVRVLEQTGMWGWAKYCSLLTNVKTEGAPAGGKIVPSVGGQGDVVGLGVRLLLVKLSLTQQQQQ